MGKQKKRSDAFWAGFTAFFANLTVLEFARIAMDSVPAHTVLAAILASLIVGATVYGRRMMTEKSDDDE